MKKIIVFALFILSLASAVRVKNSQKWVFEKIVTKVQDLESGGRYAIFNQRFDKYYGKSHLGWVFPADAKGFILSKSGNNFYLYHDSGYLKITSSARSFSSSASALTLTNSGGGICISRYGKYLRMYYQYVFPVGQYRTNLAGGCGSWERFEFRKQ